MTKINTTVTQKNVTNVRLIALLVLLFLSSMGVFGQNKTVVLPIEVTTEVLISDDTAIVYEIENTVASTTLDFAFWFMGNKQATSSNSSSKIGKKEFITSGISPNSVLIKTFLKRLANQEKNIV
jgi:hypothetical protein